MIKMNILYHDVIERIRQLVPEGDQTIRSPMRIIHSLNGAMLSLASEIDIDKLSHLQKEETFLVGVQTLPDDRMMVRADQGIIFVELDGRYYRPVEQASLPALQESMESPWQVSNPLFHIDFSSGRILVNGVDEYGIVYVPELTLLEQSTLETMDFPFPEGYDRVVVDRAVQGILSIKGVLPEPVEEDDG